MWGAELDVFNCFITWDCEGSNSAISLIRFK